MRTKRSRFSAEDFEPIHFEPIPEGEALTSAEMVVVQKSSRQVRQELQTDQICSGIKEEMGTGARGATGPQGRTSGED
jgi:hypothetical protein